jgi:hypothetical protein
MPSGDFRAIFLPYCIQRQPDGTYTVLNRDYKPLGFKTDAHIKYENYPICVKIKDLTAVRAGKLSFNGSKDLDRIYLYNGATVPIHSRKNMDAYLAKLAVLAKYRVA